MIAAALHVGDIVGDMSGTWRGTSLRPPLDNTLIFRDFLKAAKGRIVHSVEE